MSTHKYKVGQKVRIATTSKLTTWGRPNEDVGYEFIIGFTSVSQPSETPLYGLSKYGNRCIIAAEANLELCHTIIHTRLPHAVH